MKSGWVWSSQVLAMTLLCSACTQEPAEIVYKGSQFFGREHEGAVDSPQNETFSSDAPRYKQGYARPVESAEVPAVGVSDLPPPTKSAAIQDASPSAGKGVRMLGADGHHAAPAADAKEVQVADIREDTPVKSVHKVSAQAEHSQFIWPVDGGKVISRFDAKSKNNDGINIAIGEGEPIFAAADGTVVYAGNELQGYGNMVIIRHADGWMTAYAHARSLAVKKGAHVKQSDLIAYVGSTGNVKKSQLHFALRKGKTPVNPEEYLPKNG